MQDTSGSHLTERRETIAMLRELERKLNLGTPARDGKVFDVRTEGVETVDQKRLLTDEGCDFFQGFLLGRPLPPEAVEPLWQHGRHFGTLGEAMR